MEKNTNLEAQEQIRHDKTSYQKTSYQGEMEQKLQELGAKLDEMKAQAAQKGAEAEGEVNKQIEDLTAKRNELQQKLADLKSSSDDAWGSLQAGVQKAWDDLYNSVEEATSHFK